MEYDNITIRYKELACAVIEQEINDFLQKTGSYKHTTDDKAELLLYDFCTTNEWFNYLDLDGEYLYLKILKMKREGRKTVWQKSARKSNSENK